MTITYDISLGSIIVGVVGTLLTALILFLIKKVLKVIDMLKTHEKILFGDPVIPDWNDGLIKICLANRKYSINDRRAFICLISILCRNKQLEIDGELAEAIDLLKKE